MLKTSVQSGRILYDDRLEEGFRMLHQAGFEAIDFNIDEHLPPPAIRENQFTDFFDRSEAELCEYFRPHKELAKKYGIAFGQMHTPFPPLPPENEKYPYMISVYEKCLAIAAFLECPYAIIHPMARAHIEGIENEWKWNIQMYSALIPAAKRTGVKICLENMFHSVGHHITEACCSYFPEACQYIDTLNEMAGEECFAFCLDIGHATLLGKEAYSSVCKLGSRIQALHIHDNDGVSDLHLMPFTYSRKGADTVTDWDGFLRGLHDIGYSGTVSLETYRVMDVFPKELHQSALNLLHDISAYMAKRISE